MKNFSTQRFDSMTKIKRSNWTVPQIERPPNQMIFIQDHDYCSANENENIGFPGTKDRPCRPGRKGSGKGRPGKKGRSRRDRRRDRKKTRRNRRDKKENDTSEKQLPKVYSHQ